MDRASGALYWTAGVKGEVHIYNHTPNYVVWRNDDAPCSIGMVLG
jgi:hypothetical protein